MNKRTVVPIKNTIINSLGTFLSRVSGIIKFNVVNYLFGAQADSFYSANANIISLRKVFGEGPLGNIILPIFSHEKHKNAVEADKSASNILNQVLLVSLVVVMIGWGVTPLWTTYFLPGFVNDPEAFRDVVQLTQIMLLSTLFFSSFSIAMGILNAQERFIASANASTIANLVFIVFPLLTYQRLGILSLGWAVVIGTGFQFLVEVVELWHIGFRYHLCLNFKDNVSIKFWKLFFPASLTYLAQSGISIGMGYFSSFLPRGSITYLRNANTIINAPVGFIGVAISGAIFPLFAKNRHDLATLSKAWSDGILFFLFASIPISGFFVFYPDVIVNIIFRDISLFVSGSTGKFTPELLQLTIEAVQILGTVLIPWSIIVIVGKLFYALQKPLWPLYLSLCNFTLNIIGYILARHFHLGGTGLVYADLISAWISCLIVMCVVEIFMPSQEKVKVFKKIILFIGTTVTVWLFLKPIHTYYLSLNNPLLHLLVGGFIFSIGLIMFGFITHILNISPLKGILKSKNG